MSRAGVLGCCPIERRKIPDTSCITGSSCFDIAVVSTVDLNARVDEDEFCAAQLRYANRHRKGLTERGSSAQETSMSDLFFVVVSRVLFAKNI